MTAREQLTLERAFGQLEGRFDGLVEKIDALESKFDERLDAHDAAHEKAEKAAQEARHRRRLTRGQMVMAVLGGLFGLMAAAPYTLHTFFGVGAS